MNPNVSNDPWWHQSPDFYQQLESDFGFPPLSMKESQPSDIYAAFDSYSKPTTPSHSEASGSHRPPNEPRESDSSVSSVFEVLKPVSVEKREVCTISSLLYSWLILTICRDDENKTDLHSVPIEIAERLIRRSSKRPLLDCGWSIHGYRGTVRNRIVRLTV